MPQQLRNLFVILSLSGLITACSSPIISGLLGLPTNGAVTTTSDDEIEVASVNDIPNDIGSEVEINAGSWNENSAPATTGANSAITPSDGSASGEDTTIPDSAPGADTPDLSPLSSGTVDLPVSISREDDDCTIDQEGEIEPVMMSYSGSSQLSRTLNHGLANDQIITMNYTRLAKTGHLSLDLPKNALAGVAKDDSNGNVGYEQCEIDTDKDGKPIYTWQPLAFDAALNDLHEIVVGTLTQNEAGGWTQSAVRIPLDEEGHFRFSSQLLNSSQNSFNYVGVICKVDELEAEPFDALIFQKQHQRVRMDRTKHLKTYIQNDSLKNAPSVNFTQ